jgi:hypothetical protein
MMNIKQPRAFLLGLTTLASAHAGDLAFSDPANVTPAPAWAVGQANRAPDLDALPGFQKPPPGFGTVPFYWWLGDPLTQERLGWIFAQMAGMGISGYQINYAHSDKGGRSFGLTLPSEPALFSEPWWQLTGWFMQEAKKQGAGISLSDYTLGFGQGWCVDEILREHPDVNGMTLRMDKDGKVTAEVVPWSLNPMHPQSGKWYAEKFFGQFERRFRDEGGKGLNFFFSDELGFGISGRIWSPQFADEFKKRKGYDITPELPALFKDIGPRTPKVRLDYSDVMVSLTEEGFFKPVFDWHQQRGMIMGCDHGGRGRNVVEFGDYFRTQRWNQGPGADQPGLGKNLIKAKVAASIAHLYERPRVWLEGFYGSGWGTTSASVVDATLANYVMGFNLLGIHGMYYATHGGWWEWAPPDNTFRMPYWKHLRGFMDCQQRLAYLLSQGHHRCDVAILYPVAPMEAGMDGAEAVKTAFTTGEQLYAKGMDFDFMDFESLARAKIVGKELHVSGEIYRVLVLPAMKAVRHSTLQKALAFHRAGGSVIALGALPEASDRVGRDDPEVAAMVKELFPNGTTKDVFAKLPARDYEGPGSIQHRKLGPRDLYAIYGAPQGSPCKFRATGQVELWDPWTGTSRPLEIMAQSGGVTELALPLTEKEIQLLVFSPGQAVVAAKATSQKPQATITLEGAWDFELQPTSDNRFGDFHWPPTPTLIGTEIRQLWYCEGDSTNGPWRKVTCSFGPQFIQSPTPEPDKDGKPYDFSWRWGLENDPGHQGYHGLKEEMHDEFLAIGKAAGKAKHMPNTVGYELAGHSAYFSTAVIAPRAMTAYALTGALKPSKVWLNGAAITGSALTLQAGANALRLQYDKPGRTYFVVSTVPGPKTAAVASNGEAFAPTAFWIWYPNERADGDRWFRKAFELDAVPAQARLRITCDNGYAVSINGNAIGRGSKWEAVQEYDVTKALRTGHNEIVVRATNTGADAGLIAELTAGATKLVTDRSWRAAKTESGAQVEAEQVASFTASLWYKHRQGPPKLEGMVLASAATTTAIEQPKFTPSDLAMSWWKNTTVLPFDVRAGEPVPVGWYRFTAPPGLRALTISSARGKLQAWADGKECRGARTGGRVASGGAHATSDAGQATLRLEVPTPTAGCAEVVLRIEQERGCYGGAALPDYIQLDCGPGRSTLGDWSQNDGLATYSGGAWYRKTVTLTAEQINGASVRLDLGDVAASAEVLINGRSAGTRVAPPWKLDITRLVRSGDNQIEVLVCNTLANHYLTVPTRYRGKPLSGLLGPVQIELTPR